ncbi:class I SAM-dependent methyltransferase [Ascidiimonas aurantiaca]|uniref:class I SAM-dependent methyltransferase n=1 Tax=Ascidiimonas aurantiaca TaxID=1685432 RepID=UPI0030EE4BEB
MKAKDHIIESWKKNAKEWVRVIEQDEIPSRQYTNTAIVETLATLPARTILDVGCGEGWLTRSVTAIGKKATGIDAIPQLLKSAGEKGPEPYFNITYEDIINNITVPNAPFDAAVFNFCLYQKEGLVTLLKKTRKMISEQGYLVIQTLHPYFLFQNQLPYQSQWIDNSWKGLPGNFEDGHTWYARTFENWINIFNESELHLIDLKEVVNDEQKPLSVIFTIK